MQPDVMAASHPRVCTLIRGSSGPGVQLLSEALFIKNAEMNNLWVIFIPCFVTRIHV